LPRTVRFYGMGTILRKREHATATNANALTLVTVVAVASYRIQGHIGVTSRHGGSVKDPRYGTTGTGVLTLL
jgi:hypothetical protein